jgi:hypothetical protein
MLERKCIILRMVYGVAADGYTTSLAVGDLKFNLKR